jgi:hypothetical protein
MAKAKQQRSKRERLHEILALFGDVTPEQFAEMMRDHKLTADDIDLYCKGELQ